MEQLNPAHAGFPMRPMPNMIPPGLGNPTNPAMLAQVPYGQPNFPQHIRPVPSYPNEQEEKKKEFARGVFISGFEKCVTTAMIQHHFSIKPIHGLKHPMTKFKESKGFAFIYYGSEDDALYVKKTLDRTAILKDKVRITRTVISQNLSKMMFKLKTTGLPEAEVLENETKYFNDENLQKQVERIIKPIFGTTVQVNKITIPHSKADKKPLRYARVFFYVSDVKQAKNVAEKAIKSSEAPNYDTNNKNEYEIILNCISEKINGDEIFSKIARSEIYQYTKKNQSNVLHVKGIKYNPNEDQTALANEIKEFVQSKGQQWNIINAYASPYEKRGAWANITFSTYEQTVNAYESFKTSKHEFRNSVLYASLRNVKDSRTVVISVVRKDATEKDIEKFLNQLATKSHKVTILGEEPTRKYEYFSFNIIESKRFFKIDGDATQSVTEDEKQKVQPSWIEINEVPRRLIIHFFHEFTDEEIKELNNDITVTPGYETIFMKGDSKKQLRSNHQKGHVNKDGVYIKHTELKGKKKTNKQPNREKPPRRNFDNFNNPNRPRPSKPIDFQVGALQLNKGPPKIPSNYPGQQFRPAPIGGPMGGMSAPNIPGPGLRPQGFNPPPQSYLGGGNIPPNFAQYKPNYPNQMGMSGANLPPGLPNLGSMPPGTLPPQQGNRDNMPIGMGGKGLVPPPMGSVPPMGPPPPMGQFPFAPMGMPKSQPPGFQPPGFPPQFQPPAKE